MLISKAETPYSGTGIVINVPNLFGNEMRFILLYQINLFVSIINLNVCLGTL